jgi:hypothetical protein
LDRIVEIFFLPPLAIGRLGAGDTPVESFVWATDPTLHGGGRTVIMPAVTLEVQGDGSLRTYIPSTIRFRDGKNLRPVAPFFELWARIESDGTQPRDVPLTLDLLADNCATLDHLQYTVTVANKKAQRRTGAAGCGYIARVDVAGADHARKPLLAYSPHDPDEQPLVYFDRPIPLGHFQVIRPTRQAENGVDLSIARVRFTPARGEVYGPPTAIAASSSALQPGEQFPAKTEQGRLHEIVPPQNRILNPNTPWSTYVMDAAGQADPQPSDSYDGADIGDGMSWGVVDDTCDGIIEAQLVVWGTRLTAMARVTGSSPDFAPDRRPFFSFAEDLADRDLPPLGSVDTQTAEETEEEIADLFERALETARMLSLDGTRYHGIANNQSDPPPKNYPDLPQMDARSMSKGDMPDNWQEPFPDQLIANENFPPTQDSRTTHRQPLPYSDVAKEAHEPLADVDALIDFLQTRADFVRRLIRPPWGRFRQLDADPGFPPNPNFRDPRVPRDQLHDMRMPPYMRDSDENALSLNWRQYSELLALVDYLAGPAHTQLASAPPRRHGPLARRISRLAERVRAAQPQTAGGSDAV